MEICRYVGVPAMLEKKLRKKTWMLACSVNITHFGLRYLTDLEKQYAQVDLRGFATLQHWVFCHCMYIIQIEALGIVANKACSGDALDKHAWAMFMHGENQVICRGYKRCRDHVSHRYQNSFPVVFFLKYLWALHQYFTFRKGLLSGVNP